MRERERERANFAKKLSEDEKVSSQESVDTRNGSNFLYFSMI